MIQINRILRTRRRSIALHIDPDGSLTVRAPLSASEGEIRAVVEKHQAWIRQTQQRVQAQALLHPLKTYTDGDLFWFLGQQYPLKLVEGSRKLLELRDGVFRLDRRALVEPQQTFREWYRRQAQELLPRQVAAYAARYGFSYRQVRITSARTRWGSCNSWGTISFPWRLVMAPPEVADYVIVHELVHTRHPNHSPAFWAQVAVHLPDYRQRAQWLKSQGAKLALPRGENPYN